MLKFTAPAPKEQAVRQLFSITAGMRSPAPEEHCARMRMRHGLLIWGLAACAALQGQTARQALSGHVRPLVASGRAPLAGALPAWQRLHVAMVLPLRNKAALEAFLGGAYDRSSAGYRRFLTVEEFTARFGPSPADYQAVADFARARGFQVEPAAANRLEIRMTGTVEQIEEAFHVRMNLYRDPVQNRLFFSPDREPSLDLSVAVAHIAGLNDYSLPRPMVRRAWGPQAAGAAVTGSGPGGSYLASDMRAAYYGDGALDGGGETVGLVEFDGYDRSDVDLTLQAAGQPSSAPIQNVLLDGADGTPVSGDDAEAVLDIVQALGMAPGLSQVRVYIGTSDADILNAIAAEDVAREVSISWTWSPDDPATDDEFFAEMAAQGQSVFAASGDDGQFDPLMEDFYPAEDAYVTAVGGTHLSTEAAGGAWWGESAWTDSGGGVSPDGIPLPAWQGGVATDANAGSSTLRNVPDVAMEADFDNYLCDMGVCEGAWAGTSFAAPRWAAFIALANQQGMAAGDGPVGLANPALYAIGKGAGYGNAFHDIVQGNNDSENGCCGQPWYSAVAGYDLVTGWGSPAGQGLIDALAPPAAAPFRLSALPANVTIEPGQAAATVITVVGQAGFNQNVSLSVSGLPAEVSAAWSDNPASASSTLTIAAGAGAMRGTYLATITGTSGAATASLPIAVSVNAAGFSILPGNSSLLLYAGASATTTIDVTPYGGFAGAVNFAVTSALPAGVTASWRSNSSTSTAELTLTAGATTAPVRTMVTITGYGGALTASTTLALNVDMPVFVLNLSPYPLTLARGGSFNSTVTVVPLGSFTAAVAISATQLPPGVSASLNPATTAAASTLTLTAADTASTGTWPVDIRGSTAGISSDAQFSQKITAAPQPGFNLAVSPSYIALARGQAANVKLAITGADGLPGPVALSADNLPEGVTATWSQNPATASSVLTLAAGASAPAGPGTPVIIEGTSGALAAKAWVYLRVDPAAVFALASSPASLTLGTGSPAAATIAVLAPGGLSGAVNYAVVSPLPAGISASVSASPAGSATFLISADSTATPGSFAVIVAGTSGGQTVTVSIPVALLPSAAVPQFSVAAGEYSAPQTVSISDRNADASLYYTTDGTVPGAASRPYTGPLAVQSSETVQAIAMAPGYAPSAVASAAYTIRIQNSVPVIGSISPAFTSAGAATALTLSVNGSGFVPGSVLYWGSSPLATQFVSGSSLTGQVPTADLANPGIISVSTQNPPPGGVSNLFQFELDSSGGASAPLFSSPAATITAGQSASYAVTLPSEVTSASADCLNLPSGASCHYSAASGMVTISTVAETPRGSWPVTVVFTETGPSAAAGLLLPLLLLPYLLARSRLNSGMVRIGDWLCLVLAAAALISACAGSGNSPGSGAPANPARTVTSSGVVTLTIQ